jgi:hypothetical protein
MLSAPLSYFNFNMMLSYFICCVNILPQFWHIRLIFNLHFKKLWLSTTILTNLRRQPRAHIVEVVRLLIGQRLVNLCDLAAIVQLPHFVLNAVRPLHFSAMLLNQCRVP